MISVSTSDLREFVKKARFVKPNMAIAILGYIKLTCENGVATLVKTNLGASIAQVLPATYDKDITILLDERIVSNLCGATQSSEIKISTDGQDVFITDGRTKLSFQFEDIVNFPPDRKWDEAIPSLSIGQDVIKSIGVASKYIAFGEGKTLTHYSFVHLAVRGSRWDVYAMGGNAIYAKSFKSVLPKVLLSSEACAAISGLDNVQYQLCNNTDLFKAGEVVYGFTQQGFGTPGYEGFLGGVKTEGGFIVAKDHLVRFCELSMGASPSNIPLVEMQGSDGVLHLSFEDKDYRVSNKEDIEVEMAEPVAPFTFNAKSLQPALKALPYEVLHLIPVKEGIYSIQTKEDPDYLGIYAGIVK
jgi:DNA polymerase III sliding clamp (beta) subunit (PCNA family)